MRRLCGASRSWEAKSRCGVITLVFAVFYAWACCPVQAAGVSAEKVTGAAKPTPEVKQSGPQAKKKKAASSVGKKKQAAKSKRKKASPRGPRGSKDINQPVKRLWDFQSPKIKKIPSFWEPISGKWQLAKEPEHPGNRVLRQTAVKRNFQYLLSREKYANFEFSARMRVDSFERKTRNWQLGLIFRRANPDYYYKFRITAANLALLRCSPGSLEVLPHSQGSTRVASATGRQGKENERMMMILPNAVKPDEWVKLSVACYGERIIVKLNQREIRMVFDSAVGSGRLGIYSYKTQAFFDDFRLYYLPVPRLDQGLRLNRKTFSPVKEREVLVYFLNPRAGNAEVRVLGPDRKLFNILTKGWHGPEVSSVAWDGRGLLGEPARAGQYTIEVEAGGTTRQARVRVKGRAGPPKQPNRNKRI